MRKRYVWLRAAEVTCWCGAPADDGRLCTKHGEEERAHSVDEWPETSPVPDLTDAEIDRLIEDTPRAYCICCGGELTDVDLDVELCAVCFGEPEYADPCNCNDPGCACNGIK